MSFDNFMADVVGVARGDMVEAGYEELLSPEQVDEALSRDGTTLVLVNSVCGCAGGIARPAAANAIHNDKRPDHLVTVFARSEEHTSELQSRFDLVCRLLLVCCVLVVHSFPTRPSSDLMVEAGYEELLSPEQLDEALSRDGTTLVLVNSVCGCARGIASPAAANAIHYDKRPDHLVTVFA